MADAGKSTAAKAATNSSGPSQSDLDSAIGATVKLTTVSPVTSLQGTLFTADPTLNLVALKTSATDPNASGNDDYHVIPISKIQSFQVVSLAPRDANGMPSNVAPITASDNKALKAREAARIRELQEVKRKTGVDVPADAQALFDALYRIYPTIWRGQDIQVSNAVLISPPYEKCKPFPGKEGTLQRFQMIVDGERKKMAKRGKA